MQGTKSFRKRVTRKGRRRQRRIQFDLRASSADIKEGMEKVFFLESWCVDKPGNKHVHVDCRTAQSFLTQTESIERRLCSAIASVDGKKRLNRLRTDAPNEDAPDFLAEWQAASTLFTNPKKLRHHSILFSSLRSGRNI